MHRSLPQLNKIDQEFIDLFYVQLLSQSIVQEMLNIDLITIRKLKLELAPVWRPLVKVRDKWKAKKVGGNFWDFYHWYLNAEKHCHYCGVTEEELGKLHLIGILNKRPTRGRTLEIDRKIASETYDNHTNLTYSCYWCNNAKTDTFSEEEFKIIGKAIGAVWQQRLKNSI